MCFKINIDISILFTIIFQSNARNFAKQFYTDTLEGINNTNHYVRSETADTINGVWLDAKPTVQGFLDDLKNLTLIEEDIEEFKIFLNNSYYANDFYIKDIINVTLSMFNESAMKSLPKIIQEIWAVIGDSGTKIKESILWVTEEVSLLFMVYLNISFINYSFVINLKLFSMLENKMCNVEIV